MKFKGSNLCRHQDGFTLMELIVVMVIIGILAIIAIPQYTKTAETSKADQAVSMVQMIATTNRMYKLNYPNWTRGQLLDICSDPATACAPPNLAPNTPDPACNLMACNYLAKQCFGDQGDAAGPCIAGVGNPQRPYLYYACDGGGGGGGCCGGTDIACAARNAAAGNPSSPYSGWVYHVNQNGIITAQGGAPPPPAN